jgi:hypothetical protein
LLAGSHQKEPYIEHGHHEIESRRACPELVERGRLNFKRVQIRFEKRLGSATTLYWNRCPFLCYPERTRISYFTALTSATFVVLPTENHMQLTEAIEAFFKSNLDKSEVQPSPFDKLRAAPVGLILQPVSSHADSKVLIKSNSVQHG